MYPNKYLKKTFSSLSYPNFVSKSTIFFLKILNDKYEKDFLIFKVKL